LFSNKIIQPRGWILRLKQGAGRIKSMNLKLSRIFKNIPELEPAPKLAGFILVRIERERNRIIREKKALAFAGLFGSALTAVYAISALGQEIVQSDFWRITSLIFSDINIIARNWNDYALSLLETFPAVHAVFVLAPIFVLLISLNTYLNLTNQNKHRHI
jgi:hypothetical protein